ncbi:MAG: AAA family ATPase [Pseudomonadota bacterium]
MSDPVTNEMPEIVDQMVDEYSDYEVGSTPDEILEMSHARPIPRISCHAFCETQAVGKPIERLSEDRRMARANTQIYMGGLQAAVEFYQSSPTPNLLLLESTLAPDVLMEQLGQLSNFCDPSTKVVVIGHQNDVALYRDLTRAGISEYLVAPISIADMMGVVSGLFVDPEAEPVGRLVAFIGAKGGVGSSTISHNVAWAISTLFSSQTVVADMDLPFGTANINFDKDPTTTIAEAAFAPERVDEVYLDRLLAECAANLSLLAAPSMLNKVYDFDADAFSPILEAAQRTAPTVVLDVPHTWNGWTKKTLTSADEIVIVATPDLACLRNTKNLVDTLRELRPNDFEPRLIMNMTDVPKRPEIAPSDFASPLNIKLAGIIPFDPALFGTAANNGRMLAESDPAHPVVSTISDLAHLVTGRSVIAEKPKAGLAGVLSKLKLKRG